MGTNYYMESAPCEKCGCIQFRKHIGKSSQGWSFSFQGFYDHPRSYQEWLDDLSQSNVIIRNEYGEEISLDDFKKMVENKKDGLNHTRIVSNQPVTEKEKKYIRENPYSHNYVEHAKQCWIDPEGHSFSETEFS